MGRGEATRRRQKNQEKAALLKGKPLPLRPEKKVKKVDDGMTRAMKKMLQLKQAAAAAAGGKRQAPPVPPPRQQQQQQQQQRAAQPAGTEPPQGAGAAAAAEQAPGQEQQEQQQEQQAAAAPPRGKPQGRAEAPQAAPLFEQKRLKGRKKDFLKKKKLKKRHGHADPLLTEKEVELKAAAAAAGPRFGEQAYQPLKVQLKRKHWAGEGAEEASRSRLTQLFDRQMSQARAAAAAAEAARDDGARPQPPRSKAAGGGGKKKQRGPAAPPDEAVRQQLIDTYRHQKLQRLQASGKAPLLSATAQSLAELVRRDAGKDSFHR